MEKSTMKSPNKSPIKSPIRAGSPIKSGSRSKGEHKVQFSDDSEQLGVRGTSKVVGKPPEVPRTSLNRFRLGGSCGSSSSSSSNCSTSSSNSRLTGLGGSSNSGLDSSSCSSSSSSSRGAADTSKWSHSLDRKRAGSLRNKSSHSSSDRSSPQSKDALSRSHSLDRRRAEGRRRENASPTQSSNGERKRRGETEEKTIKENNKEKKAKTRSPGSLGILHSRSFSGERSSSKAAHSRSNKQTPPGLPITIKGDKKEHRDYNSDQKSEPVSPGKLQRSQTEWAQRIKRPASRSPHRSHTTSDVPSLTAQDKESDKENQKIKDNKDHRRERGRPLKRETRNNKQQAIVKTRIEEMYTVEKDVMWLITNTGTKKYGYLLFNNDNLEKPPAMTTAKKYSMTYKFSQADSKLIRLLLDAHGFTEVENSSSCFNLYWGNAHFNPNEIRQLHDWQKVNHFPRSSELTRKDRLYMNIKRMQRQFGVKSYDFIPTSFILPTEYRDFCDTHLRERGTWIVKPVASSQGKGIYLVNQVDQVPADETSLVCRYIEAPLLVDGFKCDLRLYVAVTSLDPLVCYMYEEGLVRLATIKYQHGKNLWNPCIHLTNYSVNKFHSNYVQNEDAEIDDKGNKWSLSAFLRHLKSQGIDTGALMRSVEDVIVKSLLAASYQMNTATNMFVPHPKNCFELYGFDILIDSQLKPWVLEVNLSPSLNIDQPLDLKIKSAMLADLFSLVGLTVTNPTTNKQSSRTSVFRKLPFLVGLFGRYSTDMYERSPSSRNTQIVPSAEELRIVRQVREEYERRGGWARIFPTPDSWSLYGGIQEYESPLNLVLHYHLYPQVPRTNRWGRVAPGRTSSVSSSGLASSLERLSCYERALPKGVHLFKDKKEKNKKEEKTSIKDMTKVKANVRQALENGLALSKYQARMAFSVYLQHIQRRLMIGSDEEKQTDLVYRFLRSATRTLHVPMSVQAPSKSLPNEARAVVISKQLGDFIQAYTKETHIYLDQGTSASCSSLSSQCPTSSMTTSEPGTEPTTPGGGGSQSSQLPTGATPISNSDSMHSMSGSTTSLNNPQYGGGVCGGTSGYGSTMSINSPPSSSSVFGSSTSIYNPGSLGGSSTSINSPPPSISVSGSSSSVNLNKSCTSVSSSSLSTVAASGTASGAGDSHPSVPLPPRVHRLKSDADAVQGPNIESEGVVQPAGSQEDESGSISKPPSTAASTTTAEAAHIEMDLYRAFMSNAGESDLEEILTMQTRIHNSAGVFLETNRRSRYATPNSKVDCSTGTTPTPTPSSTSSSRPRTPTASPHGSPRRTRRSPSRGSVAHKGTGATSVGGNATEPVTNEPHSAEQKTTGPTSTAERSSNVPITGSTGGESQQQQPSGGPVGGQESSAAASSSSPATTSVSGPSSASSSHSSSASCCLFGNILKASLKGTNTPFTT